MAILNKIFPLLLGLTMTGCYDDFTPDAPFKPVLCINSMITAGETIKVNVSHTWLYTDSVASRHHNVDDAEVEVRVNGIIRDADYVAREGDHVEISATSRLYGSARAEVTVPEAVEIPKVRFLPRVTELLFTKPTYGIYADIDLNMLIEVTIDDPAGVLNYYHYSIEPHAPGDGIPPWEEEPGVHRPQSYITTGTFRYESEPVFAEHIGEIEAVSGSDAWGFTFFTDRQFEGASYTLHLSYSTARIHIDAANGDENPLDFSYEVKLTSVSESCYNWANYQWQKESGFIGDMAEIGMADPVWGYSNVSTGAGVVAAKSTATYRIDLSDWIESVLPEPVPRE